MRDINSIDILGIKSPIGSGKTEFMSQLYLALKDRGYSLLGLSHRNSLALANVQRINEKVTSHNDTLSPIQYETELVNHIDMDSVGCKFCHSIYLTIDSLHDKGKGQLDIDNWGGREKFFIVIDEAEQFLDHLVTSPTLKYRQLVKKNLEELLAKCVDCGGKIILLDADLSPISLKCFENLTEKALKVMRDDRKDSENKVRTQVVINNFKNAEKVKKALMFQDKNPDLLIDQLIVEVGQNLKDKNGKTVAVFTGGQKPTSKTGTINLESLVKEAYPKAKVLRVDSETTKTKGHNAFQITEDINKRIKGYDVIICSPTIETGVSIDAPSNTQTSLQLEGLCEDIASSEYVVFSSLYGIAWGIQTVDKFCQFLGRIRDVSVPRKIWIEERGRAKVFTQRARGYSIEWMISRYFKENTREFEDHYSIKFSDAEFKSPWFKALCQLIAKDNVAYKDYKENILKRLVNDGHEILVAERSPIDGVVTAANLDDIREENIKNAEDLILAAEDIDLPKYLEYEKRSSSTSNYLNTREKAEYDRYKLKAMCSNVDETSAKAYVDGYIYKLRKSYYMFCDIEEVQHRDFKIVDSKIEYNGLGIFDLSVKTLTLQRKLFEKLGLREFPRLQIENGYVPIEAIEALAGKVNKQGRIKTEIKNTLGCSIGKKDDSKKIAEKLLKDIGYRLKRKRDSSHAQRTIGYLLLDTWVELRDDVYNIIHKEYLEQLKKDAEQDAQVVTKDATIDTQINNTEDDNREQPTTTSQECNSPFSTMEWSVETEEENHRSDNCQKSREKEIGSLISSFLEVTPESLNLVGDFLTGFITYTESKGIKWYSTNKDDYDDDTQVKISDLLNEYDAQSQ
ncbi:MAG: hypothetical protein HC764_21120, partial [Pleurocapsa sp. CRU_1_2]|nr:hypothetical protein [Pleurocapsa sp. CRU_1_2]